MATGGGQAGRRLPDDNYRLNAMILRSEVDRNQQPLDYVLKINRAEASSGMESEGPAEDDWLDDAPLEAIKNDYEIDVEILGLRKREPCEDNRKRKLCYSPYADDGYGLSRRTYQRLRYKNRQIRGRGKRFKKDDSMNIDDEPIVVMPSDDLLSSPNASQTAASPTSSQNGLSDVEVYSSYVTDEEAVRDEEEMDEEEEMEANLPDELMNQIECNFHFGE